MIPIGTKELAMRVREFIEKAAAINLLSVKGVVLSSDESLEAWLEHDSTQDTISKMFMGFLLCRGITLPNDAKDLVASVYYARYGQLPIFKEDVDDTQKLH